MAACVPEDFVLAPGEMSLVDRVAPEKQHDIFRCFGCTQPACQVCAPWRVGRWGSVSAGSGGSKTKRFSVQATYRGAWS